MASGLFVVSAVFVAVTAAIATGDLAWQALDDVAAQRALILYVLGLVHGVLLAASLLARRAAPTRDAAPGTDATIEATPLKCASPPDFEPEHVSPRQLLKDIAATPRSEARKTLCSAVTELEGLISPVCYGLSRGFCVYEEAAARPSTKNSDR